MLWFEGSIPAAIAAAKQRSFIFVVVITGEDEQSAQLMSSWDDEQVSDAAQNCCVAIKIDATSETCVQFSQIYPVVCMPSSFFIGENGIPLEVIAGSVSAEELMKRIDKVKQMHAQQMHVGEGGEAVLPGAELPMETRPSVTVMTEPAPAPGGEPLSIPPELTQSPAATTDAASAPASAPALSKESLSRPAEGGGPSGHMAPGEDRSASSDDTSHSCPSEQHLDAKVESLTKKLEEKREQRKKGEEEGDVKKETERRKLGKEMVDFKRKQEDDKTKRIVEERNREKAEEKAARDRVKQQIALDRADRAARYAQNHEEVEAARLVALQARQAEQEKKKEVSARERSSIARIQFRLPDGSFFTNQFPAESRLQEARQFVVQEVGNRYGNFSLATMFPRREFTGEDLDRTLLELELAPSASIVLLPQSSRPGNAVQSSGGGIWAMLGTVLYPLLAVWRFLSGFLFATAPPTGAASTGPAQRPSSASASSSASSDEPKRETLRKRTLEKRPEDFKKDGKIYRLRTQEDSEDDSNTWNGNSTQQM